MKKKAGPILVGFIALFIMMQLVPAGRTNPPVEVNIAWIDTETEALARRACYDCHTHESKWPWYSRVAPISWIIVRHVKTGREYMNLSLPDPKHLDDGAEEIEEGHMPLPMYTWLHPEARLTDAEKQKLMDGWIQTFPEAYAVGGENQNDGEH